MKIRFGLVAFAAASLVACGGGGSDGGSDSAPAPAPAPVQKVDGLWIGSTSTNRTVNALVLDNGAYWVIYSVAGNPAIVGGAVQGSYTASGGTFTSTNGKDFNLEGAGILPVSSVAATYQSKTSFNGQLNYATSAGSVTFNATYNAGYDKPATLSAIAGSFTGVTANGSSTDSVAFTISASGAISGTSGLGCSFSGTTVPRSGVGAFDVTVTYRGGACAAGTATESGAAYFDTATNRLFAAGLNAGRTDGFLFVGNKAAGSSGTSGTGAGAGTGSGTSTNNLGSGSTTVSNGGSSGCGSRGGPGYRLRNGNCASWADYYAGRR